MPADPLDQPQSPTPPKVPVWIWLVSAASTLFLFNAWAVGWHHWTSVLAFEVPSRTAIAHGHLWTLFTYGLVGSGLATPIQWLIGLVGVVFLFVVARLTEAELPHWNFLGLCAACALGGSAVWLPLHWADGASLVTGCSVLVLGLLSFWCFTVPDEPMPLRLLWMAQARPPMFFWLALALETGAFVSFELPQFFGHPGIFRGNFDHSAHLGGMLAGWAYASLVRRRSIGESFTFPTEVPAPKVAAVSVGARRAAVVASVTQPSFATTQELRAEVDRILDKINHDGIETLSPQERQTLAQAKQLLKK